MKYRKTALLEVIGRDDETGDYKVQNAGEPSDNWWIPQATFEATYEEVKPELEFQDNATIDNNFKYHVPKSGQPEKYNMLREKAKELAHYIDSLCPASREKAVAMTNLEQAIMWANAAIARN